MQFAYFEKMKFLVSFMAITYPAGEMWETVGLLWGQILNQVLQRVSPEASTLVDVHPSLLFLWERWNRMCKSLGEALEEEALVSKVHKVVIVTDLEQNF